MPADPRIYDSDRLARCYAQSRPPIHDAICTKLFDALPAGFAAGTALDIDRPCDAARPVGARVGSLAGSADLARCAAIVPAGLS